MKNKIRLDTMSDINNFLRVAQTLPGDISVEDSTGTFRVNGKSLMGLIYASAEFGQLYVISEHDIYERIEQFIEIE